MPAPRIVFMPGVGADPEFWKPVGDRLPAAWDKVYLGWPGLGDQPSDPSVSGWDDLLRLTLEAVGPGTADLVAQSIGGFLALADILVKRGAAVNVAVRTSTFAFSGILFRFCLLPGDVLPHQQTTLSLSFVF